MKDRDTAALDRAGLNLRAVFDLDGLPADLGAELRQRFDPDRRHRQLILVGHAGTTLWAAVQAAGAGGEDPIDDFSVATVDAWFAAQFPRCRRTLLYPGSQPLNLQALGRLAGWHHPSPLGIGIDAAWGTWYAYRVALLADTDLEPTRPAATPAPCDRCRDRPCLANCPGEALGEGSLNLEKCARYRCQPSSACRHGCLARISCPVGAEHRYCDEQIRHSYVRSLQAVAAFYGLDGRESG